MIWFYSGTPGSGKSLDVAKDIVRKLTLNKQNVISNMNVNVDYIKNMGIFKKKKIGRYYHIDYQYMTVEFLYKFAKKFHKKGKEGQTLLIIDEAQVMFSPSTMKLRNQEDKYYRTKWIDFFTQHRQLGYNIILISQFDKLIDAQIRCCFEYNEIHRKVNNFKVGQLLSIFHISVFAKVEYWYQVKEKISTQFFMYSKKYSKIYDSYKKFDDLKAM